MPWRERMPGALRERRTRLDKRATKRPWKAPSRWQGDKIMSDTGVPPAANDTGGGPEGSLPLFYGDPRPLDPNVLGGYGLRRGMGFGFSAQSHAIPISLSEFALVQKHYLRPAIRRCR